MVHSTLLALAKAATGSDWTLSREVVADHGRGSYVYTTDGRRHLDMACGIGTLSTGHCHPRVVELLHRFDRIMPSELSQFVFCNSGSEAVDNAIKMARNATGRQNVICFEGGFHGRTYGAMALTTSKTVYRQAFGPLVPGVATAPYPYCLHCRARTAAGGLGYTLAPFIPGHKPLGQPYAERQCCGGPLEALHWMLKMQSAPQETAAIIVEPVLGEGGFLTPPPGFLDALRAICDQHGILLIFDEVQSGVGRTGTWWAHQQLGSAQPDLMLFAKGIASGMPFAGVAARPGLFKHMTPGMLGGTYGGSAMGCAAAAATLDVIEEEGLLDNARVRGQQLTRGLIALAKRYPIVDVRGHGLMVAAELGAAPPAEGGSDAGAGVGPAPAGAATALTAAAGQHDMLLLSAGARETIRFLPPLNVSEGEIAEALSIFEACLEEVFGGGSGGAAGA
eukprot:scaffold1.g5683.t1